MKKQEKNIWDVAVIGGGPAGMMAAGRAAELGRSVVLFEKNLELGRKLLLTGGGRCNLTNNIIDNRALLAHYGKSGKFLFSSFSKFSVGDTIEFFNHLGVATKVESQGRVFPVSNNAHTILDALIEYMKKGGVRILCNTPVANIAFNDALKFFKIQLGDGKIIQARSCVVATGGIARPETGSSGDGFLWLKKFGHTIYDTKPALVPIALKDSWIKKTSGITLEDIKFTIFQKGKIFGSRRGELLFTHFGISGPTVLNMSKDVGELLQYGDVDIILDLFPDMDQESIKQKIQSLLISESNKIIKNTLSNLLPASLIEAILEIARIDAKTPNHSVRREERVQLAGILKAMPLKVSGLLGVDKAIASSGGVVLTEIDGKTMGSRLVPNLFVIGDVLDIDRPSGGFSLQLSWTTGYTAGNYC